MNDTLKENVVQYFIIGWGLHMCPTFFFWAAYSYGICMHRGFAELGGDWGCGDVDHSATSAEQFLHAGGISIHTRKKEKKPSPIIMPLSTMP